MHFHGLSFHRLNYFLSSFIEGRTRHSTRTASTPPVNFNVRRRKNHHSPLLPSPNRKERP
jgi:hypothetical protein